MVEFLRSLFGTKDAPAPEPHVRIAAAAAAAPLAHVRTAAAAAAVAAPSPPVRPAFSAPDYSECTEGRYFEILETYQNRARPLHDQVTWDTDEEARLRDMRIEAYQLRTDTEYKPHDVFHLWPYHPVDPAHVMKQVMLKQDTPRTLPEYSQIMNVNVVSHRVMKAITTLEDRHAFYPLDIVDPEAGLSYHYYFLQFLEHTDCTVPKLGGFRQGVRQDNSTYWVRMSSDDKVWLDAERVGGRHLFYDKRAKSGWFISGELAAMLGDFLPRGYYLVEAGLVRKTG